MATYFDRDYREYRGCREGAWRQKEVADYTFLNKCFAVQDFLDLWPLTTNWVYYKYLFLLIKLFRFSLFRDDLWFVAENFTL
jgi:hypothetical protein